ncbi:MAG: VOC family protein [Terriglobales bacterium]
MPLLYIGDSIYIGVTDVAAASSWYAEKLGLKQVPISMDDAEACVSLAFSKDDENGIILGPAQKPAEGTAMLFASNVGKARDLLSSRGVNVGPIEQDRQGTRYFVIRDLEGNEIEVPEEP